MIKKKKVHEITIKDLVLVLWAEGKEVVIIIGYTRMGVSPQSKVRNWPAVVTLQPYATALACNEKLGVCRRYSI